MSSCPLFTKTVTTHTPHYFQPEMSAALLVDPNNGTLPGRESKVIIREMLSDLVFRDTKPFKFQRVLPKNAMKTSTDREYCER